MSAIKKFFQKLKSDKKFKDAGAGHKLSDQSIKTQTADNVSRSSGTQPSRVDPTDSSRRAGAAALARIEKQNRKEPNWSLSAIRAQARKELDLEKQAEKKLAEDPKEVFQESAPVLAVSGVFYACPMVGPHVLPLRDMEAKIKEFLYQQLEEERGLTSCLIIHTCNKNKEKVKQAIDTIEKYLNNIVENPTEEKYRKIRLNNRIFQEKVACIEGTSDFLLAAGFQNERVDGEEYLIYPEARLGDLEYQGMLLDALKSSYPIIPELDRNVKVLMPAQAADPMSLPSEFFNLTVDEVKREQEQKSEDVEVKSMLRTKAMRERDAIKERRRYRFALLRVRFPDGIILQGTFSVAERLSALTEFVKDHLANPDRTFQLCTSTNKKLTEFESSLQDLGLSPAAIVNLSFEDGSSKYEEEFLRSETMALLESL